MLFGYISSNTYYPTAAADAAATATATATTAAAFASLPVKPATSFNSKGLPVRPVSDRPPFTFCATSGYGVKMWVKD